MAKQKKVAKKEELIGKVIWDSFDRYSDTLINEIEIFGQDGRVIVKTENITQSGSGANLRCSFFYRGIEITEYQRKAILYLLEPDFAQEYGRFIIKEEVY